MHSAIWIAVSYKPLSSLSFARYTEQYGSYIYPLPLWDL